MPDLYSLTSNKTITLIVPPTAWAVIVARAASPQKKDIFGFGVPFSKAASPLRSRTLSGNFRSLLSDTTLLSLTQCDLYLGNPVVGDPGRNVTNVTSECVRQTRRHQPTAQDCCLVVSFLEYEFRSNLTDVTVTSPAAESCVLLR